MGALIIMDDNACSKCDPFGIIPLDIFLSLIFNTIILVFCEITTLLKPEIEFNNKVTFLFGLFFHYLS